MGEPLTEQKLTDMWRAGYCRRTVEFARTTADTPADAQKRQTYLRQHVPECIDCFLANKLKNIEANTASAMGPNAFQLFTRGGNITALPHFKEHFKRTFGRAKQTDPVWSTLYAKKWLAQMAQRGSYPPSEDEHGQESV